jgi:hypothetical protein
MQFLGALSRKSDTKCLTIWRTPNKTNRYETKLAANMQTLPSLDTADQFRLIDYKGAE